MGLVGIHDPDALWHFAGFTYCTWCRKGGQNEGTVVNHLRTTHYRLGLVCDKCHSCLTTTSDTLCHHGCHNCHQVNTPSELVHLTNPLPELRTLTKKSRWNGLPRIPQKEGQMD